MKFKKIIIYIVIVVIFVALVMAWIFYYKFSREKVESLEKIAIFFNEKNLWSIEFINNKFIINNKEQIPIEINYQGILPNLIENNISLVYYDFNNNIYFNLIDSDKIYVYNYKMPKYKKWDLVGRDWKVINIINDNWIILNKCNRNNCPELDK